MVKWDFDAVLLDTIIEKYENEYVKVVEVSNTGIKNYWLDRKKLSPTIAEDAMVIYYLKHGLKI